MENFKLLKSIFILFFLPLIASAQFISPSVINTNGKSFQTLTFGMDVNIGEPITNLISNEGNQITQGFLQPEMVTLDLKVFIEGFYNSSTGRMRAVLYNNQLSTDSTACDFLTIQIHDAIQKDSIVDSFKAVLHTNGDAEFYFPYAIFNHSYYIVVNHRNSTQIWSKEPVFFNEQLKSIDFTSY